MKIVCPNCESKDIAMKHIRKNASGDSSQRYRCNTCSRWFSKPIDSVKAPVLTQTPKSKKFVITACQNNASVHDEFLINLDHYCRLNDAELLIVPIIYRANDHSSIEFNIPEYIKHKIIRTKLYIHDEVIVMGSFNFIPTSVNPLSGLESLSKGNTLIVPSPQLRMKSLAVSATRHPAILHTTGAVTRPEYTNTKVGEKALFNHSYSAVLVEIDSDNDYHIRVLNGDDDGIFHDIGTTYYPNGKTSEAEVFALYTGDEHAIFSCPIVEYATYTADYSIVKRLNPKYVIRGDVLDCFSISHHGRNNTLKNIGKNMFGLNDIENEMRKTLDYINRTTENNSFENIILASNHNDHLTRWLSDIDIKTEPWNAKIYFWLMYQIVCSMEQTETGFSHANPFQLYCESKGIKKTRFLKRDESFRIADVELSMHGDQGQNGSRGSVAQFSNLCDKVVIGHSHSPAIVGGAYQVGTSTLLKLDYTSGPSSWANVHCIVYPNGKRQLIRIINGKWHG